MEDITAASNHQGWVGFPYLNYFTVGLYFSTNIQHKVFDSLVLWLILCLKCLKTVSTYFWMISFDMKMAAIQGRLSSVHNISVLYRVTTAATYKNDCAHLNDILLAIVKWILNSRKYWRKGNLAYVLEYVVSPNWASYRSFHSICSHYFRLPLYYV